MILIRMIGGLIKSNTVAACIKVPKRRKIRLEIIIWLFKCWPFGQTQKPDKNPIKLQHSRAAHTNTHIYSNKPQKTNVIEPRKDCGLFPISHFNCVQIIFSVRRAAKKKKTTYFIKVLLSLVAQFEKEVERERENVHCIISVDCSLHMWNMHLCAHRQKKKIIYISLQTSFLCTAHQPSIIQRFAKGVAERYL